LSEGKFEAILLRLKIRLLLSVAKFFLDRPLKPRGAAEAISVVCSPTLVKALIVSG